MNKLTLVGTSLGNYDDISPRALQKIATAEVVLAEDTRVFGKLKSLMLERNPEIQFRDSQKIISYRDQNHDRVINEILQLLSEDKNIIQISDAGMPAISDPGYKLIRDVLENGFETDVIPSATAVESALLLSGLPTDKFVFIGFLPRKPGKIKKILDEIIPLSISIILYESPFRVRKLLEIISNSYENVRVAACKDISKKFQTVYRGSTEEVLTKLPENLKGEWTIVISKT